MTVMPQEEPPTPEEIRFDTNYGATGLINTIKESNKQRAQRQSAMSNLINSMQKMNSMAMKSAMRGPNISRGPSRNRGSGRGHGPHMKAPRNEKLAALMHAIGKQESGGNYGAVNDSSGASGKYQIMKGNFVGPGGWDKEALGRDISYRFYMRHPRAQERIAKHQLGSYLRNYGLRGAAQAWYGGPGAVGNDNISGGSGYPTTGGYADSIMGMIRKYLRKH